MIYYSTQHITPSWITCKILTAYRTAKKYKKNTTRFSYVKSSPQKMFKLKPIQITKKVCIFIDRPGDAGAVLQTALQLSYFLSPHLPEKI